MTYRRYRASTALAASLTLIIPQTVTFAYAQETDPTLLCLDASEPPCPEGEPVDGTPTDQVDAPEGTSEEPALVSDETADEVEADLETDASTDAELAAQDAEMAQEEADAAAQAAAAEADAAAAEADTQAAADAAAQAEADAAAQEQVEAETDVSLDETIADEAELTDTATQEDETSQEPPKEVVADEAVQSDEAASEQVMTEEVVTEETAFEEVMTEEADVEEESAADLDTAGVDVELDASETEQLEAEIPDIADDADDANDEEIATENEAPAIDPTIEEAPVTAAAAADSDDGDVDDTAQVQEEVLDETNTRSAEQEFDTMVADGATQTESDDGGMTNLEQALLIGLGAVAVGALINNGRDEVVANTGDRVVVQGENGLTVYRDDDALLRQPGATLRTETFGDGSTRSVLNRTDGGRVVTIRDARGRVLRRTSYLADGTEIILFDDLAEPVPVDVVQLRATKPTGQVMTMSQASNTGLEEYFTSGLVYDPGRTFSLRQIREIVDVRTLVPALDLDTVTFATGSAAIDTSQLQSLVAVGIAMEDMLARNPGEVFLIEGHTDATGSDALNLALSDRRAETVALALSQNFNIPPENLVVQGYGEQFLVIQTQASEAANRRATVRRITPLLQVASN